MKYLKTLKQLTTILCALMVTGAAHASNPYPAKPIRLVIPYSPGGTTDIIGRVLAEGLRESLGQTVIVENKAGANSMIGTAYVAQAAPDGYTLLLTASVVVMNEYLYKKPLYNARDLTPIAPVVSTPYFLIVNDKLPVKNVSEFVKYLKDHPDEVFFGSSGTGGTPHMVGELFQQRTGTKMQHVPYKGTGPATIDLASGIIQVMMVGTTALEAHIQQGTVRVLAVIEDERSPLMPEIPSLKEEGFPGLYDGVNWFGVLGPAGMPSEVTKRVSEAIAETVQKEGFKKRMQALAAWPMVSTADDFGTMYQEDRERWRDLIEANNLGID